MSPKAVLCPFREDVCTKRAITSHNVKSVGRGLTRNGLARGFSLFLPFLTRRKPLGETYALPNGFLFVRKDS